MSESKAKKLVRVLAIPSPITEASKTINLERPDGSKLWRSLCIDYSDQFDRFSIKGLIDSNSKINAMQVGFTREQGFCICITNVCAWKIGSNKLEIYEMVIIFFLVDNKDKKFCFFEEIFLLAEIRKNIAFGIFFLMLSNIEVNPIIES